MARMAKPKSTQRLGAPKQPGPQKAWALADASAVIQNLKIRPLKTSDWPHIAELFGEKGACGGCWCMYWRVERGGRLWSEMLGATAKRRFQELVTSGEVHGLLAFLGKTPVGWVCVGPHEDFPRLERVRAFARDRPAKSWSIVCFFIPSRYRRHGIATKLLIAARDMALARGAALVEGYPVPVRTQQGMPGAFAWTGVPSMFARAGFHRTGGADQARHVWVSDTAPTRRR